MAALYPEVLHVVARKDAKIGSIAALRGKRVVVGDLGSGTEQTAKQVLEAYGLGFDDLGQTVRVNPTQGIALMQDGRADAVFYDAGAVIGLPAPPHPGAAKFWREQGLNVK